MKIENPHVFREYDIRGVADRDLPDTLAHALGRALGTMWSRRGASRVSVGRDCRLSGDRLHAALLRGIVECGLSVVDIGMGPTPLLYFSVFHLDLDGGVHVTGSHNPPHENGFKSALVKAIRNYIETHNIKIKDLQITAEDIREGIVGVLSVFVREPMFQGQTKEKLNNPEMTALVDHCKAQGGPLYDPIIQASIREAAEDEETAPDDELTPDDVELMERCIEVILQEKIASTSRLQRRLKLGYTRAARMMDILEKRGMVGPGEGAKPREILISPDDYPEI